MAKVVFNMKKAMEPCVLAQKRLIAIGFQLEAEAKKIVPVRTGRLRASISTNWTGSGMSRAKVGGDALGMDGVGRPMDSNKLFTVVVGSNVDYACIFGSRVSIVTEKGLKNISEVKVGDRVLTQTGDFHKVLKTISRPALEVPNMISITFEWRGGDKQHKLTVTREHKILIFREGRNKWVKAGDLLKTDQVYSRVKVPFNKGISKYKNVVCRNCGERLEKNYNLPKEQYCNIDCRTEYYAKGNNPHIGMRRNKLAKRRMSISAKRRILEHPENHANCIMGKKGHQTKVEKAVYEWLLERRLKRKIISQYPIKGKFVDFYIPSLNKIFEADGAYWHQDQIKDIERDKEILRVMPNVKITHLHFFDERFSPKAMEVHPIEGVHYSICNPGPDSFVNPEIFELKKILNIRKWQYGVKELKKKARWHAKVYDLCVEGVHSYYANGMLVSNSHIEFGTIKQRPQPFIRPAFDLLKSKITDMLVKGARLSTRVE